MESSLTISSSAVFNKVLLFVLREADGIFRRMLNLPVDTTTAAAAAGAAGGPGGKGAAAAGSKGAAAAGGGKGGGARLLMGVEVKAAPRWRKVENLVKSYLGNSLHLLSQMTEPAMVSFTLRRLRASAAFLAPFEKINRKMLKQALVVFGSAENAPRVQVRAMGGGGGGSHSIVGAHDLEKEILGGQETLRVEGTGNWCLLEDG